MSNKQKAAALALFVLIATRAAFATEYHKDSPTGPEVTKGEAIMLQAKDPKVKIFGIDEFKIDSDKGTLRKRTK
jgi:hypothetical protein